MSGTTRGPTASNTSGGNAAVVVTPKPATQGVCTGHCGNLFLLALPAVTPAVKASCGSNISASKRFARLLAGAKRIGNSQPAVENLASCAQPGDGGHKAVEFPSVRRKEWAEVTVTSGWKVGKVG